MSTPASTGSPVITCMSYRDAPAAIDWLCSVFGFAKRVAHPEGDGIAHAELTFGAGMIMLGSVRDTEYGRLIRLPDQIGGYATQSIYVVTATPDEIYHRAKAAGARIVIDIKDESYGSRGFTCADPEGHLWTFGTYDPWAAQTQ
ncbi:MAG TPA: VOC family protein [Povalibacter sp.]